MPSRVALWTEASIGNLRVGRDDQEAFARGHERCGERYDGGRTVNRVAASPQRVRAVRVVPVEWDATFEWDGLSGGIHVDCIPNDDPVEYGTVVNDAFGFPVCTATVRYPRRGYRAMFGWVQLVRSTDNLSGGAEFEIDPLALFGD